VTVPAVPVEGPPPERGYTAADVAGRRAFFEDLRMAARQLRYEQLNFWRNRFAALFTVGFSVVFLLLLSASGGTDRVTSLGGIEEIQYYVPGFAAYGVMSACYSNLGISLVVRRESGLLKRLRLSPIASWGLFGAVLANAAVISLIQVALLLAIGRAAFGVTLPQNWLALVVALLVGVVCFTALGVAASTLVPSQDSAGPIISLIFFVLLFLSGLWFPLTPGSALDRISNVFPVHHLIVAVFAPFDLQHGVSPWAWHDLAVVAIWGAVGTYVAVRRFAWEPRRH
jgi:ABC-2 type transport system permease protein